MKVAAIYKRNVLKIEERPIPEVLKGSVRVKVKACAICGTDLRIYRKGDQVCVAPGHDCGSCRMCRSDNPNVCISPLPSVGYRVDGGFTEYISVLESILLLGLVKTILDKLTFAHESMSELFACCLNAQNNTHVEEYDVVLIMGSGTTGIIHSQLSRLRGAGKVIVTQRSPEWLRIAFTRFHIYRTIASSKENLDEAVAEETNGEGLDVIFVGTPSREAQEQALKLISSHGRINFFGGIPRGERLIYIDANNLHYKEIFISGASSSIPEGNRKALQLFSERKIDPDKLITHTFSFGDINAGFDIVENKKGIKVAINPHG